MWPSSPSGERGDMVAKEHGSGEAEILMKPALTVASGLFMSAAAEREISSSAPGGFHFLHVFRDPAHH